MSANQSTPAPADKLRSLPWREGHKPFMLAPMQGLTNRAMRALFVDWVRPDVVFTEFMRVSNVSRKLLARNDLTEAASTIGNVPLVVQLVGDNSKSLTGAARNAEAAGASHINLNLGCPYGRMTSGATGGAMLQRPELLYEIIPALRAAISGTFSIKLRAGYDNLEQVFSLLALFENAGVDFLVLHPRTVVQKYTGTADHSISKRVIRQTSIPIIVNGDIRTSAEGLCLLEETGAAGLMLGRGAIADPLIFKRLHARCSKEPTKIEIATMLRQYLSDVLTRYRELFCGEKQILDKLKNVLAFIDDPAFSKQVNKMKRARSIDSLADLIEALQESA